MFGGFVEWGAIPDHRGSETILVHSMAVWGAFFSMTHNRKTTRGHTNMRFIQAPPDEFSFYFSWCWFLFVKTMFFSVGFATHHVFDEFNYVA